VKALFVGLQVRFSLDEQTLSGFITNIIGSSPLGKDVRVQICRQDSVQSGLAEPKFELIEDSDLVNAPAFLGGKCQLSYSLAFLKNDEMATKAQEALKRAVKSEVESRQLPSAPPLAAFQDSHAMLQEISEKLKLSVLPNPIELFGDFSHLLGSMKSAYFASTDQFNRAETELTRKKAQTEQLISKLERNRRDHATVALEQAKQAAMEQKNFKCPTCAFKTSTKGGLTRHIKTTHPPSKPAGTISSNTRQATQPKGKKAQPEEEGNDSDDEFK
jgi:hypothetical protein